MRKALIILLAGIHLFGNTEFGQILKWPELFTHYFQHTRINPDINFLEFIAMHYDGDDGTDADNDLDNKLPCRDIGHNSLATMFSPMVRTVVVENFSLAVDANNVEYSTRSTFLVLS
ncbi:MAG: hypothetical protein IPH18_05675 [Chitinophagaceae bacterium]|nr:hypothetical protein [Chitinophagaceae bacterium]